MMDYLYKDGRFEEMGSLHKEGESWEDGFKRLGFYHSPVWSVGIEDFSEIKVYNRLDDTYSSYLIEMCLDGESMHLVLIENFPDLLNFLKEYSSIWAREANSQYIKEIHDMVRKLFRVYHGHEAEDFCLCCDPLAYRLQQQRKQERLNGKAGG